MMADPPVAADRDRAGVAAEDWRARVRRPAGAAPGPPRPGRLPAPTGVAASGGAGHVLLDWEPVEGALGYLVHRAGGDGGPFEPVDHGGGDVLAVPAPPYADTTLEPGRAAWYAVASWTEGGPGPLSAGIAATAGAGPARPVAVEVDAAGSAGRLRPVWRRMLGSEHLSLLRAAGPGPGGTDVAAELAEALRIAREQLGCEMVRAHGTFLPEMVACRPGQPPDFGGLDAVYDRLLDLGLRPVVELSFMPAALAADPDATVFAYRAIVSPPADWAAWGRLCGELAAHLVERYGADEVATWAFEVWNEANLEVFWTGTEADYFRLYDEAARAIKAVDRRLRVGGPSTARAEWVGDLLAHARAAGVPVDFVSTHTYGNAPLDLRPLTRAWADGQPTPPAIWWTEWGVTPTHFAAVSDAAFGAPFVLRGVKAAMESADALAYWVVSDHFEELGRPPSLFHGGFGLLTVGNLRKPRFWALELLGRLGQERLAATVRGDGACGLVDALAARDRDGSVAVLLWNGTLDQGKVDGDPLLDRAVTVRLTGLRAGTWRRTLHRVDAAHGNLLATWRRLGAPAWPDQAGWRALRAADRLDQAAPASHLRAWDGAVELELDLPMPGAALVRLTPAG
jgi:xylan 1,4-beta-xylosidase